MAILTLQQAKDHARITTPAGDPGDADLTLKLAQAEAFTLNWSASSSSTWADAVLTWTDTTTTPLEVQAAILVKFTQLTRFLGDDVQGQNVPRRSDLLDDDEQQFVTLMRRYRDPVLA